MHIPDGFLDGKTAATTAVLSAAGIGYALRRVKNDVPAGRVPLMGLAAAFVFVAQMLNFPVAGGTSGHMIGAVLAAVLLGPAAGIMVMTSVLIVQCFLFSDGGITALGANIFNMGICGTLCGSAIYRALSRPFSDTRGRVMSAGFASWCATVLGAALVAGELAWSGTVPWSIGFPAMVNVHMLVGLVELAITALVLSAVWKSRPDLLAAPHSAAVHDGGKGLLVYTAIVVAGLALFVAPFASPWPDALGKLESALGFDRGAMMQPVLHPPMAEYRIPGLGSAPVATGVAGAVGTVIVFFLALILARLLIPRSQVRSGARPSRDSRHP